MTTSLIIKLICIQEKKNIYAGNKNSNYTVKLPSIVEELSLINNWIYWKQTTSVGIRFMYIGNGKYFMIKIALFRLTFQFGNWIFE